jgi:hypothetical protein
MILLVSLAAAVDVSPGEDWCAIIAAAAPGSRIDLGPGDFAGPCWISNSVTVMGNGSRIVYAGTTSNVLDIDADDVELGYLSFGPTEPDIDAIKIRGGSRISVFGCTFDGIGGISVSANSADTAQVQLIENTFTDLEATGVYLGCHDGGCASTDFFIANNRFDGVTSSGVGYAIETKLNSWGLIGGNDIRDAQGPGITVYGSEGSDTTLVEGNVVVGSREAATLEIAGGPAIVRNNVVIGGAAGGLYVYDYGDRGLLRQVAVLGNTLWGVGGDAITWEAGGLLEFRGNAAGRDDGAPAWPSDDHGASLSGNVDCADGAACWRDASALDLWPLPDGALVGAGDADPDLPWDHCGVARPDPPTAGALEPASGGASFASYVADRCPAPADTGWGDDTGAREDSAGNGDRPDGAEPCGCGDGSAAFFWIGVTLVALGRRSPRAPDTGR